ncbi:glycine-rich domain-containing protein [Streptomyces sp. NPDC002078]
MTTALEAQVGHDFATSADYRNLISPELYGRVTRRLAKEAAVRPETAERMMDASLGFLYLCATNPEQRFTPTPLVDEGWHTFIVYTREYAEFCSRVAGGFIHHEPRDNPNQPQAPGDPSLAISFMKAAGLPYDELMWDGSAKAECCGDSPGCSS